MLRCTGSNDLAKDSRPVLSAVLAVIVLMLDNGNRLVNAKVRHAHYSLPITVNCSKFVTYFNYVSLVPIVYAKKCALGYIIINCVLRGQAT